MRDKYGPCPNCNGNQLFRSMPQVGGAGINQLLPGLGFFGDHSEFHIVVCRTSGLMRLFASQDATDHLETSKYWTRVS
jgi:hypothetical protein